MPAVTRTTTSGGRPSGQQKPAPKPPLAATVSPSVQTAARSGAPKVTLAALPAESVGTKVAADEVDLSSGELVVPEAVAAQVAEGKELELKTRLPGLAQGSLRVRKLTSGFHTAAPQAILLSHPALARFAASNPMVLVIEVKENKVGGWVGLGQPGPAKGNKRALIDGMSKGAELLGWAGLSKITFPAFRNQFDNGVIDVAVEHLGFTLGGFLAGSGNAALDNKALSFDGSAKINIPGGSSGELAIKRDPTGSLAGKLDILVQIGSVSGTVNATLAQGFVSIMGSVAYSGDRLSGKVTLVATDEVTARNVTLLKPSGGDVPIELPGPDKPAKPGKRAFCGWGTLTFRVTDWLAGSATVIVNSLGQATIVGEIAPPKEFILFEQKEWIKRLLKLEIKAGYGIPVVGQVGLYANISLDAIAKLGPGKLYNIKLSGAYSTDPRVAKNLSIEGTLNISAFAGLRLRAEAGMFVTIIGHDIKVGAGLNAIAGVRGYVEATPRIGMRELAPGQRQYFIQGHLEIAAQPVLGFGGDLFVKIETPWWSPLSDKTWTWPLFSLEYPLPGEFGIGADVDYVLGSKQWPKIAFGEVNFDSSKFMTDVMNDNTDKGGGKEQKKQGEWQEGAGAMGPGGAKNKGGAGKKMGEMDDDIGPIGEQETFSDGGESHRLWFEQKGEQATLLMASENPGPVEKQLDKWALQYDMLTESDEKRARTLMTQAQKQLKELDAEADQVAIVKTATKRAKDMYEKNKGKKGKKTGKGKDGAKELNKKVRSHQRTLKDTIQALAVLMHEIPFKQIKETAEMWDGGKESVRTVNKETHAGLEIAGKPWNEKMGALTSGPLSKAVNEAGLDLIEKTKKEVGKQVETIEKAKIRRGRVKTFHVYDSLPKPTLTAANKIGLAGRKMKIKNLDRALRIEPIPKSWLKQATLEFAAHPKRPNGWKADKEFYRRTFLKEMDRQLALQQVGLAKLTVDEWIHQLMLFSMDAETFAKLDTTSRMGLLQEVYIRAQAALLACNDQIDLLRKERDEIVKQIGTSDKTLTEINREIKAEKEHFQRLEKAEIEIGRSEKKNLAGQAVAPSRDELAPFVPQGKGSSPKRMQGILGRFDAESDAKKKLALRRDALIDEIKDWDVLTNGDVKELHFLHNPDQVAGGYDGFEDFPVEPSNWKDAKKRRAFLLKLRRFYGPARVNSTIGGQWSTLIRKTARADVMKAVPQAAYGLHRLNFTLKRKT